MPITIDTQRLRIDGVKTVVVSTIQPDTESTTYVRLIQVYDEPSTAVNRRPILELALYGGDQTTTDSAALAVQIPPISQD